MSLGRFHLFCEIIVNANIAGVHTSSHSYHFSRVISKSDCCQFCSTKHIFEVCRLFVGNHWLLRKYVLFLQVVCRQPLVAEEICALLLVNKTLIVMGQIQVFYSES